MHGADSVTAKVRGAGSMPSQARPTALPGPRTDVPLDFASGGAGGR
jgi:hypothetical protein